MSELSKKKLLEWYSFWFYWLADAVHDDEGYQALEQIKALIQNQPEVSEKDIYDFHDGYAILDYDDISDNFEMRNQEKRYIKNWLKSIGVKIKEKP